MLLREQLLAVPIIRSNWMSDNTQSYAAPAIEYQGIKSSWWGIFMDSRFWILVHLWSPGARPAVARFPCRQVLLLLLPLNGTIPHFDSSLHPLITDHPTILELGNTSLAYLKRKASHCTESTEVLFIDHPMLQWLRSFVPRHHITPLPLMFHHMQGPCLWLNPLGAALPD